MNKYILLLFCTCGLFVAQSQETTVKNETDEIIDELFMEDDVIDELIASIAKYELLYISVGYNSATYFSGRNIGIDQFNINPQISYANSNGIFLSLSGIYYSQFLPGWDVTTATIGYGKGVGENKMFKYDISYSRYFYSNKEDNIYSNTLNVGVGVENKKRTLGARIIGNYLFGEDQAFQLSSRNYVAFNLYKSKKMELKFKPQLNIVAGTRTIELSRSFLIDGEIRTEYVENSGFDLINTQLHFPLLFRVNSFDFEVSYIVNFPNAIRSQIKLNSTNYFNVSVAYLLSLD